MRMILPQMRRVWSRRLLDALPASLYVAADTASDDMRPSLPDVSPTGRGRMLRPLAKRSTSQNGTYPDSSSQPDYEAEGMIEWTQKP